jgi:hypothetical protein
MNESFQLIWGRGMRRLLLIMLCFLAIPAWGQDSSQTEVPTMPNLSGLTVPQAHTLLYERGLELEPIIVSTNSGTGRLNSIIDQSLAAGEVINEGTVISVTVLREYNLELIWESQDQGDEAFTIVNLTESLINLEQLLFEKADGSRRLDTNLWPNELRERQCIQLWPFEVTDGFQLPECNFLQGGGILSVLNESQQFWRGEGSFYVSQEGLRRAECQILDGRCQIWVSPSAISEEFSPYVFLTYNPHELIIHNRSESEWLPLNQLALNDSPALNDVREWDVFRFSETMPFLAPNQCVRFSDSFTNSLVNCIEIASRELAQAEIFWRSDFTVHSLHLGDVSKTCPAALGDMPTICLLLR